LGKPPVFQKIFPPEFLAPGPNENLSKPPLKREKLLKPQKALNPGTPGQNFTRLRERSLGNLPRPNISAGKSPKFKNGD